LITIGKAIGKGIGVEGSRRVKRAIHDGSGRGGECGEVALYVNGKGGIEGVGRNSSHTFASMVKRCSSLEAVEVLWAD
jgi:hypothetical protein